MYTVQIVGESWKKKKEKRENIIWENVEAQSFKIVLTVYH